MLSTPPPLPTSSDGSTETASPGVEEEQGIDSQRRELLEQLEAWLEVPMLALGFVWLALLVIEFTRGLSRTLEAVGTAIWAIFVLDFALKFALAPRKLSYLKSNWLTALSLLLPALRIARIARVARLLRVARTARGLRLFRLLTSLNRGFKALGATMGRRGFGYAVALTILVALAGAAGMFALEREANEGFGSFGQALWWTAMLMTTLGSEAWPQTPEGRLLCFGLALYAFAVFGYVTATLATFFIGRDAHNPEAELPSAQDIASLRAEIQELRGEIASLGREQSRP